MDPREIGEMGFGGGTPEAGKGVVPTSAGGGDGTGDRGCFLRVCPTARLSCHINDGAENLSQTNSSYLLLHLQELRRRMFNYSRGHQYNFHGDMMNLSQIQEAQFLQKYSSFGV